MGLLKDLETIGYCAKQFNEICKTLDDTIMKSELQEIKSKLKELQEKINELEGEKYVEILEALTSRLTKGKIYNVVGYDFENDPIVINNNGKEEALYRFEYKPATKEQYEAQQWPKSGDCYYFFNNYLHVDKRIFSNDDYFDTRRRKAKNCFKTKEQCQQTIDKIKSILK